MRGGHSGAAYLHDLLEQLEDETIEMSVLEAALASLGEGCADGQSNDNVVGVLLCAVGERRSVFSTGYSWWGKGSLLHGVEGTLARSDVAEH